MNTFVHSDNTLTAVYHENEVLDTSKKVIQAENDFIFLSDKRMEEKKS
jgi:hypothetical protein